MNHEALTREVWEKCRAFNIDYKNRHREQLAGFRWLCWVGMKELFPEILYEYNLWIDYLLKNGVPDFDPAARHKEAVENRILTGWTKGPAKDNLAKTDPYLIEFGLLPDWLREMCIYRDRILIDVLRGSR